MLAILCASLLSLSAFSAVPHDPERQLADLSARIQEKPDDASRWLARGVFEDTIGDTKAALADLSTTLRLDPRCHDAVLAIAAIEHRRGNHVEALLGTRRAASLGASGAAIDRLRGRILMALHRPDEAAAAFAAAMRTTARPLPEHFLEHAAALALAEPEAEVPLVVLEHGIARLGPVVALIDAAVAIDVRHREFGRALLRIDALRPHLRSLAPLHERRARVLDAAGRCDDAAHELELARAARGTSPLLVADTAVGESDVVLAAAAPSAAPVPLPTPLTTLVPANATWRYLDQGIAPPFGWQALGFDDSAWASGPAQLGYGDGDEATVVASGPAGAHYPTTWFRHTFQVTAPSQFPTARIRLLVDDGAVVSLNGVEIARWNVANGPVAPTWWATLAVSGADESAFRVFSFPTSLLLPGNNVVAVEVHQSSAGSSDVSFALEMRAGDEPATIVRGPYVQNGTPSSAVVMWRTDQPTATQLWVGPSTTALQLVVNDPTPRTDHAAPVTGLAAESLFHYRVGDGNGVLPGQSTAQTFRTLPPIGAVRPLRVWALGDMGFGSGSQLAVRDAFTTFATSRPADAILMLGDNAYYIGTDLEYQVGVFDVYRDVLRSTFAWPTLGNHDAFSVVTALQAGPYYDAFTMPTAGEAGGLPSGTEAYYSFDRGHVHFVCLDSMDSDRSATGAMMTWLTADLAATNARWTVAYFHHPPYSFGSHNSDDPNDSGGRMADMRAIALPILEAGGVDLVLAGHCHDYERSFLLDGHYGTSATLQPSMLLDRGDGDPSIDGDGAYGKASIGRAPHEGAVYVVAGSAGALSGGALNHPAMHVGLNHLGSLVLDFDGDRLDGTFVGLTAVEDRFTIVKGENRTFFRDQPRLSVGNGGRQDWRLAAGSAHAGRIYGILASLGTAPGFTIDGVHVPLNLDNWTDLSIGLANSPIYPNSFGFLDSTGAATSAFVLPPLNDPTLVGLAVHHAYLVLGSQGITMASNPVKVTLLP